MSIYIYIYIMLNPTNYNDSYNSVSNNQFLNSDTKEH